MSQTDKIFISIWFLVLIAAISYWGNLAWFHPNKLKNKLIEEAKRKPDWLFMKGYSLKFTEKYEILMMRFTTLAGALCILAFGILIVPRLLGIMK